jgi:hypothetical protein
MFDRADWWSEGELESRVVSSSKPGIDLGGNGMPLVHGRLLELF